jgi:hypothetical protein
MLNQDQRNALNCGLVGWQDVTATKAPKLPRWSVTFGMPLTRPAGEHLSLLVAYRVSPCIAVAASLDPNREQIDVRRYSLTPTGTHWCSVLTGQSSALSQVTSEPFLRHLSLPPAHLLFDRRSAAPCLCRVEPVVEGYGTSQDLNSLRHVDRIVRYLLCLFCLSTWKSIFAGGPSPRPSTHLF